ncbi:TetR-like C-terminal domain-containing protein [Lysinibacillus fusiformis]|uniref:TetR-like C-terminal domain-containing protein n=1 Tax=Lysinibacillus fusiformis TaxID=28031 RepID=UPI003D018D6A
MLQAVVGRSGDDAIRAMSKAYIQFVREHPSLYNACTCFPDTNDPNLRQAQESIVQLVHSVLETYHLQDEMAIHMGRGLCSILHGFTSLNN